MGLSLISVFAARGQLWLNYLLEANRRVVLKRRRSFASFVPGPVIGYFQKCGLP
jgi:hypothetical protein